MKYHAKLIYGANQSQLYNNWDKENMIEELIRPFINGQVVYLKSRNTILNLKTVSELKIFKTPESMTNKPVSVANQLNDPNFEQYNCTKEIIDEAKTLSTSEETTSLLQKSFAVEKEQVFIVMKFGDKVLDSAYEGVIKPLLKKFKLAVIRVDEIQDSGKISDQILQHIAESKFIISELTGERPNCYYETGFAHALGKEIILSIHLNSKIHFDLAGHRFIQWETESDLRKQLNARIKMMIKK